MFVVVAYDVANDRRRDKVMKLLDGYGAHVQESVFECDLETSEYRKMLARLERLVDTREDNVRLYHLCETDIGRIGQMGIGLPVTRTQSYTIV